jgi:hypothetical protein
MRVSALVCKSKSTKPNGIELDLQSRQYDIPDKLTLSMRRENQLYRVVQVMKRLMRLQEIELE